MKKFIVGIIILSIITSATIYITTTALFAAPNTMPLISRNIPVYASGDVAASASDSNYSTSWKGTLPGWVAYDLSGISDSQRNKILFAWYNCDTYDYDPTVLNKESYGMPKTYTIEANTAAGGSTAPTSGWKSLATVTNNVYHSRQHLIDFSGYNWVRINITAANGSNNSYVSINIDIHSAPQGATDSWIFYGDSITAGGMVLHAGNNFAQLINASKSSYYPAAECGGTGAILSSHGVSKIDTWLGVFPGKYVGIAFGTNDAWGNQTGADNYYKNIETIVKAVLAAGKIPCVSKIPWSTNTDINKNIPTYNAKIDELYQAYPGIIKGPDFEALFKNNTSYLSSDNVHPSDAGYTAMRKEWANTMLSSVYSGAVTSSSPSVPSSPSISTSTSLPSVSPSPSTLKTTSLPSVSTTSATLSSVSATLSIVNEWGTGGQAKVVVKNNGSAPTNGWSVSINSPGTISNIWGGKSSINTGNLTITNESWNAVIPAGGSVEVGFIYIK